MSKTLVTIDGGAANHKEIRVMVSKTPSRANSLLRKRSLVFVADFSAGILSKESIKRTFPSEYSVHALMSRTGECVDSKGVTSNIRPARREKRTEEKKHKVPHPISTLANPSTFSATTIKATTITSTIEKRAVFSVT